MFQDLPPVKGDVDPTALRRDDSAERSEIVRSFMSGLSRAAAAAAVIVSIAGTAADAQLRRPSPAELTPLLETDAVRAGDDGPRGARHPALRRAAHQLQQAARPASHPHRPVVSAAGRRDGDRGRLSRAHRFEAAGHRRSRWPSSSASSRSACSMAVAADAPPGELVVPASLRYQACDEKVCYPPVTLPASWTLRVVARNAAVSPVQCRRPEDHRVRHRRAPCQRTPPCRR